MMSTGGTDAGALRVLFVGLEFDYGLPARGHSYEHLNFLDALGRMQGVGAHFFPFDTVMRRIGRKAMNARLIRTVQDLQPDICLFSLFTDEIDRQTIRWITEKSGARTLNWFGDDHWRFSVYSRYWAPLFHWVLTTDSEAVEKYRAIGCHHVCKTQWACNQSRYRHYDIPEDLDVTFVGQVHSRRRTTVEYLRKRGVDVRCWGTGWESGRLDQDEMVRLYSRSKINLSFAESSVVAGWKPVAKIFLNRRADDHLAVNTPARMFGHMRMLFGGRRPQIKGRTFEIPGAGGFLLTSPADNLEEYYVPGKEIVVFQTPEDLVDMIRHYLAHPTERRAIREAGYLRTLREHTYEQRFREIFHNVTGGHEKA